MSTEASKSEGDGPVDVRASRWGLYRPSYEKDSCGFGLIASLDDTPSHWVVQTAISSLIRLTHRRVPQETRNGCNTSRRAWIQEGRTRLRVAVHTLFLMQKTIDREVVAQNPNPPR